jgi:adenylate cyclase
VGAGRHRRRTILLLVAGVVATGLGVLCLATNALRTLDLDAVDARFSIRGTQAPPRDVVMVGLDARSLNLLQVRPPIPRSLHAQVIDTLRRDGARAIAYDFQFTEPTIAREDNALIRAVTRAGNVVLPTTRTKDGTVVDVLGKDGARNVHAVVASPNFPPRSARGGVVRRLPYADGALPSLAVAAVERATGRELPRSRFAGDGAWIDFAGPAGTVPTISFARVASEPAATFRGKIVVVGATDPILQDVHATAAGPGMPGPEVNVNAIATILRGFPLDDAPGWLSVLLVAACGLVTPLSALRLMGLRWLPVPLALAVALAVSAQLLFNHGTIVPVAAPALALLASFLGTLAVAYWTDLRERRFMRSAFARFVPAAVVDEVVEQAGDGLRLGGIRREGTVMFCDLRGFTTVAERLEPEFVIEMLNRYLTEMSDAILDHGGTVVSYMGDGIMAVFGAPIAQDDHADRALAAAREMLGKRLERFNAWARAAGIAEPFRMGVGVCTGPVMSGNVGSLRRLEYAAIGDTTNTASRLQGMTKEAGCAALISEATHAALRGDASGLRYVGELDVRGRSARMKAWTLADEGGAGARAGPAVPPTEVGPSA